MMSNIVSALMSMLPWIYVVPFRNERLKHFTNTTTTDTLSTLHHNVTPLSNEEMFSYHNPLCADTTTIFFAVLLLTGITLGLAIIFYINRRLHLSTANVMVAAASTSSAVTLLLQIMNLPGADVSPHSITFFIFSTMIISLYTFFGFFIAVLKEVVVDDANFNNVGPALAADEEKTFAWWQHLHHMVFTNWLSTLLENAIVYYFNNNMVEELQPIIRLITNLNNFWDLVLNYYLSNIYKPAADLNRFMSSDPSSDSDYLSTETDTVLHGYFITVDDVDDLAAAAATELPPIDLMIGTGHHTTHTVDDDEETVAQVQVNEEEEAAAQVQANEEGIHEQDADAKRHAGAQPPTLITSRTKSKHSSTLLIDVDGIVHHPSSFNLLNWTLLNWTIEPHHLDVIQMMNELRRINEEWKQLVVVGPNPNAPVVRHADPTEHRHQDIVIRKDMGKAYNQLEGLRDLIAIWKIVYPAKFEVGTDLHELIRKCSAYHLLTDIKQLEEKLVELEAHDDEEADEVVDFAPEPVLEVVEDKQVSKTSMPTAPKKQPRSPPADDITPIIPVQLDMQLDAAEDKSTTESSSDISKTSMPTAPKKQPRSPPADDTTPIIPVQLDMQLDAAEDKSTTESSSDISKTSMPTAPKKQPRSPPADDTTPIIPVQLDMQLDAAEDKSTTDESSSDISKTSMPTAPKKQPRSPQADDSTPIIPVQLDMQLDAAEDKSTTNSFSDFSKADEEANEVDFANEEGMNEQDGQHAIAAQPPAPIIRRANAANHPSNLLIDENGTVHHLPSFNLCNWTGKARYLDDNQMINERRGINEAWEQYMVVVGPNPNAPVVRHADPSEHRYQDIVIRHEMEQAYDLLEELREPIEYLKIVYPALFDVGSELHELIRKSNAYHRLTDIRRMEEMFNQLRRMEEVFNQLINQADDEADEEANEVVDFAAEPVLEVVEDEQAEVVVAQQQEDIVEMKKTKKLERLQKQLTSDLSNYWNVTSSPTRRTSSRKRKQTIFYSP